MTDEATTVTRFPSTTNVPSAHLDTTLPWRQVILSLVTYFLYASDVFRSGLSIPTIDLPSMEPNVYFSEGPWAYPIARVYSNTSGASVPISKYKYDDSGSSLRAIASNRGIWNPCLDYASECPESTFSSSEVLKMLDDITTYVASQPIHAMFSHINTPMRIAARVRTENIHRLFDYVVSTFVDVNEYSTVWGAYYVGLDSVNSICGAISSGRPLFCSKSWARYDRIASGTNQSVGAIWDHIAQRAASFKASFQDNNLILDSVVLEAETDPTPRNGGFVFVGHSTFNIVTIFRLRSPTNETIAIDEYRYEGHRLWTNPEMWALWASILRTLGQVYVLIRLGMLIVGCVAACDGSLRQSSRLLLMLPSHVIVYGSWLPIACYAIAHILDAPLSYHLTESALAMSPFDLSNVAWALAVRMRSVWVLALAIKVFGPSVNIGVWHSSRGVISVKPHIMGTLAFLTAVLVVKVHALHDVRLLDYFSVEPSTILSLYLSEGFSTLNSIPGGAYGDIVALLAGMLVHGCIHGLVILLLYCMGRSTSSITFFSESALPFAAVVYWSSTAMTVGWSGNLLDDNTPSIAVAPKPEESTASARTYSRKSSVSLFKSDREWESKFTMMNIVHMTDPLTYIYLTTGDVKIYHYSVRIPDGSTVKFLHPYALEELLHQYVDVRSTDIQLEAILLTRNLPWKMLIQSF